jgi:ribosomal protein S6
VSKKDIRIYNLILLIRPDISINLVESLFLSIFKCLDLKEKKDMYIEYLGLRRAAYKIKTYQNIHYYLCNITVSDAKEKLEIENILKYNDKVIRYLLKRVDEKDFDVNSPSILMTNRSRDCELGILSVPNEFDINLESLSSRIVS